MVASRRGACTARAARVLAACGALAACVAPPPAAAEPWPAADALFQRDPRWLGGDAVYSVDLGDERVLWLFGDSFVAPDGQRDRRSSTMVRNTIAVQRGRDPSRATIAFHWRTGDDGKPAAFFAGDRGRGLWPLHGVRAPGGPLLLFVTLVRDTPGQGLGFAIDGWRLLRIDDPDAEPNAWRARTVPLGDVPRDVILGTAAWLRDGHVEVLGTRGDSTHRGVLARFLLRDLDAERVPFETWSGGRWQPCAPGLEPDEVLADAGPECSVHESRGSWLHVWSRGFGATTVAAHDAPAPHGPWSAARDLFVPPDSQAKHAFVYAAKAHPELDAGAGWLAVSYAANSFEFAELFTTAGQRSLYWPRFWRVPAPR